MKTILFVAASFSLPTATRTPARPMNRLDTPLTPRGNALWTA